MTTARRPLGVSPRRHCGALVVALFNESTRGDDVAELAVLNAMGGRARAEGPRSEATEPTILTAYGSRKPINSATRRCGACSSHALAMLEKHRSRSAGGCMRSAGRNKFNVCWAGLGACSGIFSRRSSHGVRAARYTARDVAPVVTRGADFNGRNAQVDAQQEGTPATGFGLFCPAPGHKRSCLTPRTRSAFRATCKPEIDTGTSTFNADRLTDSGLKPDPINGVLRMRNAPVHRLHDVFVCDELAGTLHWRVSLSPRVKAGDRAGSPNNKGYRHVSLDGVVYLEHRVIFAMALGFWPKAYLDHANGVRGDNRISNLREATRAQNNVNRKSANVYGLKGASKNRQGKFQATIGRGEKRKYLGTFDTAEAAHAAYMKAAVERYGEFARAA